MFSSSNTFRNIIQFVLFSSLLVSCSLWKQEVAPPEKHKSYLPDGHYKKYYSNGNLKGEFHVVKGYLDTLFLWHFRNGNIKNDVKFMDGLVHEKATEYYRNGNPDRIINYKYGVKQGPMILYTKSGKPSAIFWYENGKSDEEWKTYQYYRNDTLRRVIYYNKWKPADNTYNFYYKNGQVKETGEYKDGKKSGEWKYYLKDGSLKNLKTY